MSQMAAEYKLILGCVFSLIIANFGSVLAQNNPLPWDDLTEPAAYVTFDITGSGWTL